MTLTNRIRDPTSSRARSRRAFRADNGPRTVRCEDRIIILPRKIGRAVEMGGATALLWLYPRGNDCPGQRTLNRLCSGPDDRRLLSSAPRLLKAWTSEYGMIAPMDADSCGPRRTGLRGVIKVMSWTDRMNP